MSIHFETMALVGTGLIGGSFALRAKQVGLVDTIVGLDNDAESVERAKELGIIDRIATSHADAIRDADLVIIAVPPAQIAATLLELKAHVRPAALVMDTGSTKGNIVRTAGPELQGKCLFIGAHPIAGTERSGPQAAFAELFVGAKCILTDDQFTDPRAVELGRLTWEALGMTVVSMPPEQHDVVLAAVSHLPHMVAYALVNVIADLSNEIDGIIGLSGGGFKDTTRIASSHPQMWRDICFENKAAVLRTLDIFDNHIQALKKMVENNETDAVYREFESSRRNRARILEVPYDD